jgi:hypothetical protein
MGASKYAKSETLTEEQVGTFVQKGRTICTFSRETNKTPYQLGATVEICEKRGLEVGASTYF